MKISIEISGFQQNGSLHYFVGFSMTYFKFIFTYFYPKKCLQSSVSRTERWKGKRKVL